MGRLFGSLTGQLLALMAALTIPVTAITIFALVQMAWNEQERYGKQAQDIAFFVSKIVDNELASLAGLLEGASNSSELRSGNFEAFYEQATRLIAGRDQIIVLRDLETEQLLNTAVPFGSPLPPAVPLTEADREAFRTSRVVVGGIYASPLTGELRIPVALPVQIGARTLVLAVTAPAAQITRVLEPAAPAGWVLTVGDATGTIVARSRDNDRYAGQPALPEYLQRAADESGSFNIVGFGGQPLLTGYARSTVSRWLTGANVPLAIVEAPLRQNILAILGVASAAAVAAGLIGYTFVRRFRRASETLLRYARSTDWTGENRSTGLQEFDGVIQALGTARGEKSMAERALSERSQELQVVLDTVPAAVWFTYDSKVTEVKRNTYASRIMKLDSSSSASVGSGALSHLKVFRDDVECRPEELPLQRAFLGQRVADEEYSFLFVDGSQMTLLTSAEPLRAQDGEIVGAVSVSLDISERKRHETQQRLLINELNHRVKNTITTVQSIARQTLRHSATLSDAEKALGDRLVAVSRAYDVLTRENWEGTHLNELTNHTLGAYGLADGRVKLAGQDCWVSASNSVSLSLVLHELAVNSIKHGALSIASGLVDVTWDAPSEPRAPLVLTWRESGGPPVLPPERKGFGLELLARLARSSTLTYTMDFSSAGLICVVKLMGRAQD